MENLAEYLEYKIATEMCVDCGIDQTAIRNQKPSKPKHISKM